MHLNWEAAPGADFKNRHNFSITQRHGRKYVARREKQKPRMAATGEVAAMGKTPAGYLVGVGQFLSKLLTLTVPMPVAKSQPVVAG